MRRLLAALALSIVLAVGLAPGLALAAEGGGLTAATAVLTTQDATGYDIWVGGVEVTSANASNVTGGGITGKVSYDAKTNTLTLNNATIKGCHTTFKDGGGAYGSYAREYSYFGICGSDDGGTDLVIKLIGTNKVFQDDGSTGDFRKVYGIGSVADLTLTGDGTLAIENDCSDENTGIDCGIFTVDSRASVNVISTASSYNSTGASVGTATIRGSLDVSARSGTQYAVGLVSYKEVTVAKGGRLTASASHGNSGMDAIIVRNQALNVNGYVKAASGDWAITCDTINIGVSGELEATGTDRALSPSTKVKLESNKLKVMSFSEEISVSEIGGQQDIRICGPKKVSLKGAKVTFAKASAAYTGKAITPSVKSVELNGKTCKAGTDYTVSAKSGKNVGSYKVIVTGKGSYEGTASATFKITKASNKLSKTKVTKTLKSKSLKKKAATIALPTAKFGKATWKVSKKDPKKVLTLTKSGKVKVKKGAKANTYTMKLKANVKGTKNYKALKNKVVTVKVKVK